MKYKTGVLTPKRRAMLTAALTLTLFSFVLPISEAAAPQTDANRRIVARPQTADDFKTVQVPAENLRVVGVYPLNSPFKLFAPQVVDVASIFSNVTTFSGGAFSNGGATLQGTNTITRLVADDLATTGTPPFNIGGFVFSVTNLNSTNVSVRPLVRFYRADGAGEICVLNVAHKRYFFASPSQVLQVTGDIQGANFIAEPR